MTARPAPASLPAYAPAAQVAVVMAVHDNAAYLADALASLQNQTFGDWRCIVVDDASTDGSAEVAADWLADPRIELIRRRSQGGSGAARNDGLALLDPSTCFVGFLDGDDRWLPTTLRRLVDLLEAAPDAVGAYGLAEYLDAGGVPVRAGEHPARQRDRRRVHGLDLRSVPPEVPETTFSTLVVSGPIWPAAVALHRLEVVRTVGGFDEALRLQQDWDLYLRLSRHGRFVFFDEQVAWYRQHGTNVTSRQVDRVYFQDAVRRKTWESSANSAGQRREAARGWRALQHRRVVHCVRRVGADLRDGRLRDAAKSAAGATVLLAQLAAPGPPRPSRRLVRLTGRSV